MITIAVLLFYVVFTVSGQTAHVNQTLCGCKVKMNLPSWTSKVIAAGIAIVILLVVAVMYWWDQYEKSKSYYGKTDSMGPEEQEAERERDTIAFGANRDVFYLERDESAQGDGVKWRVLQKRKRGRFLTPAGTVTATNSGANSAVIGMMPSATPRPPLADSKSPAQTVQAVVLRDSTTRAPELIAILTTTEIPDSVRHDRRLKAEYIMETILMTLEKMLEKPVVVQGHLQDIGWIIKGSEADGTGDFTMLMLIQVMVPVEINVICFSVAMQPVVFVQQISPVPSHSGSEAVSRKSRLLALDMIQAVTNTKDMSRESLLSKSKLKNFAKAAALAPVVQSDTSKKAERKGQASCPTSKSTVEKRRLIKNLTEPNIEPALGAGPSKLSASTSTEFKKSVYSAKQKKTG